MSKRKLAVFDSAGRAGNLGWAIGRRGQVAKAEDCKSFIAGSNPAGASLATPWSASGVETTARGFYQIDTELIFGYFLVDLNRIPNWASESRTASIASDAELAGFVRHLLDLAKDARTRDDILAGRLRFKLGLPSVPPGRFRLRVAFAVRDSGEQPRVAEASRSGGGAWTPSGLLLWMLAD